MALKTEKDREKGDGNGAAEISAEMSAKQKNCGFCTHFKDPAHLFCRECININNVQQEIKAQNNKRARKKGKWVRKIQQSGRSSRKESPCIFRRYAEPKSNAFTLLEQSPKVDF